LRIRDCKEVQLFVQDVVMSESRDETMEVELTARHRAHCEEVRRAKRKLVRLTAQIELPNGCALTGHTVDISLEGVGFISPYALGFDEECTLLIALEACGLQTLLSLVGRVRHCSKQPDDSFRVGMQIGSMTEKTAEVLRAALA
jgi:PilZ domain